MDRREARCHAEHMANREPWNTFGKALRKLREERAFSQAKLAELTGLDQTTISLLERGERQPTLPTLYKLADALGTTIEDLIENE